MIHKNSIIFLLVILTLLIVGGCATLPEDFEKPESYAYTDTENTRLGQARRDEINAHPGQSGFLLLGNGLDAFLARALLAENAERSSMYSIIFITMISLADCLPIN
jgi:putative cardiolipin synthase